MQDFEAITNALSEVMNNQEKMNWLIDKIETLEKELNELKNIQTEGWMSIEKAAVELGKTVSAVRQRLKHPKKPMPEKKVWKQDAKGCAISVHLGNYRKHM